MRQLDRFFLDLFPLTVTAQEAKIVVQRDGKPHKYKTADLKNAEDLYMAHLARHKPDKPYEGPLAISVDWYFHTDKAEKNHQWRITKPDTDNLNKLFKDCMTKCGYWHDDAQVVMESITKRWAVIPGIMVQIVSLTEDKQP